MNATLDKTYDPNAVEGPWYAFWEEKGYFRPESNPDGDPFSITIPPTLALPVETIWSQC